MSERTHEQKVVDVGVDNDCLIIELFNGLRLSGPLHTSPVYRDRVAPAESKALPSADFARGAIAT